MAICVLLRARARSFIRAGRKPGAGPGLSKSGQVAQWRSGSARGGAGSVRSVVSNHRLTFWPSECFSRGMSRAGLKQDRGTKALNECNIVLVLNATFGSDTSQES